MSYDSTNICRVSWLDPAFALDDEDIEPAFVETTGWIVSENDTKRYIVVASERIRKDEYRGYTAIPISLLVSVDILEVPDGRKKETAESADGPQEKGKQKASEDA